MAEIKRINSTVPADIYEWLDGESNRTGIKKSTLIYIALKTYIDQQRTLAINESLERLNLELIGKIKEQESQSQ